jgi:hypothetical protein
MRQSRKMGLMAALQLYKLAVRGGGIIYVCA